MSTNVHMRQREHSFFSLCALGLHQISGKVGKQTRKSSLSKNYICSNVHACLEHNVTYVEGLVCYDSVAQVGNNNNRRKNTENAGMSLIQAGNRYLACS